MAINPCKDESVLSALADGELTQEETAIVQLHLESCSVCRQRFEFFRNADQTIQDMGGLEPSPDFDRAFWRKVADLESQKKSRFRLSSMMTGWRPIFATGMAAAAVVAILIYSGQHKTPSQDEALIVQNMELLQDYDVIDQLDMFEHWNDLQTMKDPS